MVSQGFRQKCDIKTLRTAKLLASCSLGIDPLVLENLKKCLPSFAAAKGLLRITES